MSDHMRTALVTGASSGFGKLICIALARQGYRVVATMRDLQRRDELIREAEAAGVASRIDPFRVDVTDGRTIAEAVDYANARYGGIGVLVNNAGFAVGGFVEEVPEEGWRAQMETNFFGVVAMTRAVLPGMRERRDGTIVMIGSLSGRLAFPGYGAYAASKFALEGFGESLRHEMSPHGVRVVLVEPGAYRTSIWSKGFAGLYARPDSPYRTMLEAVLGYSRRAAETSPDPRQVADLVARLADRPSPRLRYPVGRGARAAIAAKSLVPWRLFERVIGAALSGKRRDS